MVDEVRRAQLKKAHLLRTQFNYNIGLARIDYNMDVILPAKEQIAIEAAQGELPEFLPTDVYADTNIT